MTEREKFEIGEMKELVFSRDGYICQCCGKYCNSPQLAHGISQSKSNTAKWGKEIIHSKYNLRTACSLECNNNLAIGRSNEAAEAERIKMIIEGEQCKTK